MPEVLTKSRRRFGEKRGFRLQRDLVSNLKFKLFEFSRVFGRAENLFLVLAQFIRARYLQAGRLCENVWHRIRIDLIVLSLYWIQSQFTRKNEIQIRSKLRQSNKNKNKSNFNLPDESSALDANSASNSVEATYIQFNVNCYVCNKYPSAHVDFR